MRVALNVIMLTALAGFFAGCDSQSTPPQKKSGSGSGTSCGDGSSNLTSKSTSSDTESDSSSTDCNNTADQTPVGPAGNGDFDGWCAKAAETKVAGQTLNTYFANFCDSNGKAKALLTSTLVNTAYDGSSDPQLHNIQAISSDAGAKTTTAYFGVGIKLPISVKQHYDTVAVKGCNKDVQNKLVTAQGATAQALTITNRAANADKYMTRGCEVYEKISEKLTLLTVTTETTADDDQYDLGNGSYMYTTVTTQALQTVKDFSLLTAGIQVNNQGYLLTIAHVTINNMGFPDIATQKVKDTASGIVKAMYQAAAGQ